MAHPEWKGCGRVWARCVRERVGDVKDEDPEAIEKDEQENATAGDEVDDERKLIATSGK